MEGELLPEEEAAWRSCYRHPNRIAIRDCACCGRPICKECEAESGDDLLCLACKQELKILEEEKPVDVEQPEDLGVRKGGERARLDLSDVTVFDDGTVVHPEAEPEQQHTPKVNSPVEESIEVDEESVPEAESPAEDEPLDIMEEAPTGEALKEDVAWGEALEEVKSWAVSVETAEAENAFPPKKKKRLLPRLLKKAGKPERKEKEFVPGGPVKQLFWALPYTLLAAGLLAAVWLLIAVFFKNWNQASAFSIGIAVPWVLYKCTTIRKHHGERVWNESPPAITMSLGSGTIAVTCILLMEYFAFLIIAEGGDVLRWSDFTANYFKPVGWFLIVGGVLLAFMIPFVSGKGGTVSGKNLRKKQDKE